ncbi:MAG: Chaperone protein DnaJ [Candidatus Magasanikbacteria bacterium]|nr:Chaperone protein DnaJ [Candidatus Magasanikbacteria bacterium]
MAKDYYSTLGVRKEASPDEIKAAFRRLAHEHHPDKTGGSAEKFKEINEAYQVLGDAGKRKQYDQFGPGFDQAGGGFGGAGNGFGGFDFSQGFGGGQGINFEDLGDMFGGLGDLFGMGGGRSGGRGRGKPKGRDIAVDLELDFKEAVFGVNREISLYKTVVCKHCHGDGAEPGSSSKECVECGGKGQVAKMQRTILGNIQTVVTCEVCNGDGKIPEKKCRDCGGAGVKKDDSQMEVKIPAGIDDGEAIRLSGYGEAVPHGGRAGDLYITVHVRPDSRFERRGPNIYGVARVSFATATLGGTVKTETADGLLEIKIAEGTESGAVIRLKGHGVPNVRGGQRGDHFVTVQVTTPRKLSRRAKELMKELEQEIK